MTEIRRVEGKDIGALVVLARRMFDESQKARLGFDEERTLAFLAEIVTSPSSLSLVAVIDGEVVGMLIGACGQLLPCSSAVVAEEHYLYVLPAERGCHHGAVLLHEWIVAAIAKGARDITVTNATGVEPERVESLFTALGFRRLGGMYVMEA